MATTHSRPPRPVRGALNQEKLNEIVTRARDEHDQRLQGYREQALRLYPWVCTRCGRDGSASTFARSRRMCTVTVDVSV